jgi:hypothetical protein
MTSSLESWSVARRDSAGAKSPFRKGFYFSDEIAEGKLAATCSISPPVLGDGWVMGTGWALTARSRLVMTHQAAQLGRFSE